MSDNNFLGTGVSFPFRVSPGTGRFELASGAQSVRQSLYLILMTARGERWMRPGFGSSILSYTFMDVSLTMLNVMQNELRSQILEQEPRISDVSITIDPEQQRGALIIHISYTLIENNTRDNMVFPFYLQTVREGTADEPMERDEA